MTRVSALATDYDGTLATEGAVARSTLAALERLRAAGLELLLVTGRTLDELLRVFPGVAVFDRVIAENGALLYRPATRETRLLCGAPPPAFVEALRARSLSPLVLGEVIVATLVENEAAVRAELRGHALRLIRNNEALMVLPEGIDKASGVAAAMEELGLAPRDAVAVGDAENDAPMLALCGHSVAVANAIASVRARAQLVTAAPRGAGVEELVQRLLEKSWP